MDTGGEGTPPSGVPGCDTTSCQDGGMDRRRFLRMTLMTSAGVATGYLYAMAEEQAPGANGEFHPKSFDDLSRFDWGFVVDTTKCIGCGSCVRACKIENNVPDTFYRTWVERYEIGHDGEVHVTSPKGGLESWSENGRPVEEIAKAFFVPKLCNHCYNSACTQVCPVGASYESPDHLVLIDKDRCVGCGYCVQACPYGCRYIDHEKGVADKCTLCYHRLHKGLDTACVTACPREARISGNLKDPHSPIRRYLDERRYSLLKPELGTNPKCYYIGLDIEVK